MTQSDVESWREGLPDSWYPVVMSHQLTHKAPRVVRTFGGEWVLFRTLDGRCGAVQRYCCHMGTDLSLGQVRGDTLRCPLHHWRFDRQGTCVSIPGAPRVPEKAKLAALNIIERYGVIFVSPGADIPFDFPDFSQTAKTVTSRPKLMQMAAPYFAVSLNVFDVQHLVTVHQRGLREPAQLFSSSNHHLGITYSAYNVNERLGNRLVRRLGLSASGIRVDCWGGNLCFISIEGRRPNFFMALAPVDGRTSLLFLVVVDESPADPLARMARRIKLELAALLTRSFISEDIRTLSNARTFAGVLLPGQDSETIQFWQYFDDLPRIRLPEVE